MGHGVEIDRYSQRSGEEDDLEFLPRRELKLPDSAHRQGEDVKVDDEPNSARRNE